MAIVRNYQVVAIVAGDHIAVVAAADGDIPCATQNHTIKTGAVDVDRAGGFDDIKTQTLTLDLRQFIAAAQDDIIRTVGRKSSLSARLGVQALIPERIIA